MPLVKIALCEPILICHETLGFKLLALSQEQTIPVMHSGSDHFASALNDTDKSAVFGLSNLEIFMREAALRGKSAGALILASTRELAVQLLANVAACVNQLPLSSQDGCGAVDTERRKQRLEECINNGDVHRCVVSACASATPDSLTYA